MHRRNFLRIMAGSSLGMAVLPRVSAAGPFDYNTDFVSNLSYNDLAFQNQLFGYKISGVMQRIVWTGFTVAGPTRVLLQGAAQFPAYFLLFEQNNSTSISLVAEGKVNPAYVWRTQALSRGGYVAQKVNNVCQYVDLPSAGAYWFLAHDTSDFPTNECSLCVRSFGLTMLSLGQQKLWNYVGSTPLFAIAQEGTSVAASPFQIVDSANEMYVVRGCVSNSAVGQTIELLSDSQYKLWLAGQKYSAAVTMQQLFSTGVLAGANGNWHLTLKHFGSGKANDPDTMSFVADRWRKVAAGPAPSAHS